MGLFFMGKYILRKSVLGPIANITSDVYWRKKKAETREIMLCS